MSSILLEPIIPNLTKVGGSGEQLRDLWKLFTKVKDCTQGGRRLENLYWRLWYQSASTGQLKESEKISSLFESWRGPGEDFKSRPGSLTSAGETHEHPANQPAVVLSTAASAAPAAAMNVPAAAAATVVTASSTFAPPPPTPSIQITRVNSALKAMGAAAAGVAPAPATELNAPAVPVNIQAKKNAANGSPHNKALTPSKLSVGFFSEAKATATSAPCPATAKQPASAVLPAVPAPAESAPSTATRPRASTADFACEQPREAAPATTRKKFFINSLSSVSSEESLDEIMSNNRQPPSFQTASSTKPPPQPHNLFSKVAPPEPPLPEAPPEKVMCANSNLSNLLKNPRRPAARNMNILTTSQYFTRRRDADTAPQYFESESLRRGLQIDRKPLFDPSLAYEGGTPMTYTELPAAW